MIAPSETQFQTAVLALAKLRGLPVTRFRKSTPTRSVEVIR